MPLIVPLQAVPSQFVTVTLNGQNCQISAYQKSTGYFLDLYVANSLIIGGVICQNLNRIVRDAYLGFVGDLAFYDVNSTIQTVNGIATLVGSDPIYEGIGTQFFLEYFLPNELPVGAS